MMILIHLNIDVCITVLETARTPIIFPDIVGGAILPDRVKVIAKTRSKIHKLTCLRIWIKIPIHQTALNGISRNIEQTAPAVYIKGIRILRRKEKGIFLARDRNIITKYINIIVRSRNRTRRTDRGVHRNNICRAFLQVRNILRILQGRKRSCLLYTSDAADE